MITASPVARGGGGGGGGQGPTRSPTSAGGGEGGSSFQHQVVVELQILEAVVELQDQLLLQETLQDQLVQVDQELL